MTIQDTTTEDLKAAAMRALESLEGNNLYTEVPWPVDVRPLASPMTVIYYAADGKSYERTMLPEMAGDSLNVVLGERKEVTAKTLWVPVASDVAPAFAFSAGKSTTWSGMIFRAGDYPDKGCSFSEDDLSRFVANFPAEGVPVMSEHEESLLGRAMDRHGARLTRIWKVGGELHGEIRSPSWLDEALDGMRKSVSVGIDFAAKTLREISLTFSPRVADAAVFRHKAAVAFSHSPDFTPFAALHPDDAAKIVTEAQKAPTPATEDMDKRTFTQRLTALFAGKTPEQRAALTEEQIVSATFDNTPPVFAVTDPAVRAELDRLNERDRAREAQFAASQDKTDAEKAFLAERSAGRATPADEEEYLAAFSLARFKDRQTATNFTAKAEGSEESKLVARWAAKPVKLNVGEGRLESGLPVFAMPTPKGENLGVFAGDFKEETK